jgi:hypothetical protein
MMIHHLLHNFICSSMFLLLLYLMSSCHSTNAPTYVYASSCFIPPILHLVTSWHVPQFGTTL